MILFNIKKYLEVLQNKIEEKIDISTRRLENNISFNPNYVEKLYNQVRYVSDSDKCKERDLETITRQSRVIEMLINALADKYEHGLFIYSEDGKIPMVIRNGKELTDSMTTNFNIDWCVGEIPNINIEQIAATTELDENLVQPLYRN